MEKVGAISFLAPNGVLVIHDADSEQVAELWSEESQVVSSSESSLLVRVCHAIDGPVSIEVAEGEAGSRPGVQLFSGRLATLNGRLRIRDVNDDCRLTVDIDPGENQVELTAERSDSPENLYLMVIPQES